MDGTAIGRAPKDPRFAQVAVDRPLPSQFEGPMGTGQQFAGPRSAQIALDRPCRANLRGQGGPRWTGQQFAGPQSTPDLLKLLWIDFCRANLRGQWGARWTGQQFAWPRSTPDLLKLLWIDPCRANLKGQGGPGQQFAGAPRHSRLAQIALDRPLPSQFEGPRDPRGAKVDGTAICRALKHPGSPQIALDRPLPSQVERRMGGQGGRDSNLQEHLRGADRSGLLSLSDFSDLLGPLGDLDRNYSAAVGCRK